METSVESSSVLHIYTEDGAWVGDIVSPPIHHVRVVLWDGKKMELFPTMSSAAKWLARETGVPKSIIRSRMRRRQEQILGHEVFYRDYYELV